MNRRERDKWLTEQAASAMSKHVIREARRDAAGVAHRWTVAAPDTWQHGGYVTSLGRYVVVVGDLETVVLCGGDGGNPESHVRWAAHSGMGYFREKAAMGMSSSMEAHDGDVLVADIDEEIDDLIQESLEHQMRMTRVCGGRRDAHYAEWDGEDIDARRGRARRLRILREAWIMARSGDHYLDVHRHLYEEGYDPESIYRLGVVPDARLYYARALLRRLVELLDAAAQTPEKLAAGGV